MPTEQAAQPSSSDLLAQWSYGGWASEIQHHCIKWHVKTLKWDKPPINWLRISSIHSSFPMFSMEKRWILP